MIENYNSEVNRLIDIEKDLFEYINTDEKFIKWSDELKKKLSKKQKIINNDRYILSMYRPFTKKWILYNRDLIARPGKYDNWSSENELLFTTGIGANKEFSTLITNFVPESALLSNGQGYSKLVIDSDNKDRIYNFDSIDNLNHEQTFYYIYGVLHSKHYTQKYKNDLKKSIPRVPNLKNKEKYYQIGKRLAELHLNYEEQVSWPGVIVEQTSTNLNYRVKKMKHPRREVLDTIIYNESITIKNIPIKAYDYVINGRPAIEWIIDQYQIKIDKKSGNIDDPNEFSNNPRYILDLLLSIITVSMKTLELIECLPEFELEI